MIKTALNVKDYCQDCYLFEPTAELSKFYSDDGTRNSMVAISCAHMMYCNRLYSHMKNTMKNKAKSEQDAKIDSPIIE